MERINEHTGLIGSYQNLITATCTNTGSKMKSSSPRTADWRPFVPRNSLVRLPLSWLFRWYVSGILFRPQYCISLPTAALISAGRAIYISVMYILASTIIFPLTKEIGDRSLNLKYIWVACAPRTVGLVAGDTQYWTELWNRNMYVNLHDQKYISIFVCYCFESLLFYWCIMSKLEYIT